MTPLHSGRRLSCGRVDDEFGFGRANGARSVDTFEKSVRVEAAMVQVEGYADEGERDDGDVQEAEMGHVVRFAAV